MKSLNELFNMDLNMDLYNDNHGNRQHVDVGKKMMNKISFLRSHKILPKTDNAVLNILIVKCLIAARIVVICI